MTITTAQAGQQELKPCPFCGGEPEIINKSVHCNNPRCEAQPYTAGPTQGAAIAAWNRRAAGATSGPEPSLSEINEIAKVYAASYASPHHIVFTAEGLRAAVSSLSAGKADICDLLRECYLLLEGQVLYSPSQGNVERMRRAMERCSAAQASLSAGSPSQAAQEGADKLLLAVHDHLHSALRIPRMPWPDPGAHSHEATARAIHASFCELRFKVMDAIAALTAARCGVTELLSAPPPAAAAVEAVPGFKLVPVEPTDEMIYMMTRAIANRAERVDSYKAMLAAAPAVPVEAQPLSQGPELTHISVPVDLLRRAAHAINYHLEPNSPDEYEAVWKELCALSEAQPVARVGSPSMGEG